MKMKSYLGLACCCLAASLQAQDLKNTKLNLVFIGNSITQGALLEKPEEEAPPVRTAVWLEGQKGIAQVNFSNQGVSGHTTVDFLPASHTTFPKVKAAMERLKQQHPEALPLFSIMLGTNDSATTGPNGAPVSAPQYYTNLEAIVDELLARFPDALFVLHRPIWYSPTTYNGARYLVEGQKRLASYYPQLQELVKHYAETHPGQVFLGDTLATSHFETYYQQEFVAEKGQAGTFYLHPNKQGADKLAGFWGKAIYEVLLSREKR